MRSFRTTYMRGGTSKGCLFLKSDLPADQSQWDHIFLQVMGCPDPKQIDGMGGCVSSNNKIVVVWPSDEPGVDVEYLVGQVIVGTENIDWKSNCGNMTAAVAPFAVEEGLVAAAEPSVRVRMLNRNTDKRIDVVVPCENGTFAQDGDCHIAGVDGTAAELKVMFLDPAGAKTGKLMPTGHVRDTLDVPGVGAIEATIVDVSNPLVVVRAEDLGATCTELPDEVNSNEELSAKLEAIRGTAAMLMGFASDLEDARENSPAVPKVGFVATPRSYTGLGGEDVCADDMDVCARVISVFKCHKACPLTAASSIAVAAKLPGSVVADACREDCGHNVRIGHPSGVMTMVPEVEGTGDDARVPSVGVQRTARRIMDGTIYVRD